MADYGVPLQLFVCSIQAATDLTHSPKSVCFGKSALTIATAEILSVLN
jgi:hypothetical protein